MLRHASVRALKSTSGLCRLSKSLTKLLQLDAKEYHGPGLFYDEDEMSEQQKPHDRSNFRNTRARFYDSKPNFSESKFQNRNRYNNRDLYDDQSLFSRNQYSRNDFNSRDTFDNQSSFSRNQNSRKQFQFSNQGFGQNLVRPAFNQTNLPPVEKYFYVEHPDVTQRSMEEIEAFRGSFDMTVKGSDIPKPVTKFHELYLPDSLKEVVMSQGYAEPTPIQAQGWPIALSGKDMVGISQTGSGKTLVFVLPAIIHATNQPKLHEHRSEYSPQVLVLAPTRELVQQILHVSDRFSSSCGLICASAYGGASRYNQLRCLRDANICVATPGRLIDFVSEGQVNLQQCTYLVLDEADRMLDMGFEPQIRKIIEQIRPDRQTLMWSATWPHEIRNLAEDFLTDYVQVTVGAGQLVANPKIDQNIYIVEEHEKQDRLVSLLNDIAVKEKNKVLVFAQMKRTVDYLARHLNNLGMSVSCIHGDVSQSRRDDVLHRFRSQKSCVLIATDVAARGLDISDVQHVVNYDFPPNIEDYIHRIGRTARGSGSGMSHSFFTPDNASLAKDLLAVLKQANQDISPELYSMTEARSYKSRGSSPNYTRRHAPSWQQRGFN